MSQRRSRENGSAAALRSVPTEARAPLRVFAHSISSAVSRSAGGRRRTRRTTTTTRERCSSTMTAGSGAEHPEAECPLLEAPASSSCAAWSGSPSPEGSVTEPLVPCCCRCSSSSSSSPPPSSAARIMTSAEAAQSGPLFARTSRRSVLYKVLCFLILVFQGGALDFYLIVFTDLYWSSWVATDLVVITGWAIFFVKNGRSKRERACGFRQKPSAFGCSLGEFAFAYLAWLIYVIACAPKLVLILETFILELVELRVPLGVTGLKVVMLLSLPLLYCLINAIVEDANGASRHYSHCCFAGTFLDLLDSFSLLEMLLAKEMPAGHLKYAVLAVHFVALALPVLWLYELASSRAGCRWLWARFLAAALVNAPLLAVRCLLVHVHRMSVSAFAFKNAFFLASRCLEVLERCAALQGLRRLAGERAAHAHAHAHVSHCVSENDMCPRGYANTLAVDARS